MQQINSPALPGLAWEEKNERIKKKKKEKKKNPPNSNTQLNQSCLTKKKTGRKGKER